MQSERNTDEGECGIKSAMMTFDRPIKLTISWLLRGRPFGELAHQ